MSTFVLDDIRDAVTAIKPIIAGAEAAYQLFHVVDGQIKAKNRDMRAGIPILYDEEHVLPDDIREQTRRAMEDIKLSLDACGLTWRNVVKVTKFLTDMREADAMHEVMGEYFGDWKPASTMVCVNNLSAPGSRVEIDIIAVAPPADE